MLDTMKDVITRIITFFGGDMSYYDASSLILVLILFFMCIPMVLTSFFFLQGMKKEMTELL